jgi:thymidine kinase
MFASKTTVLLGRMRRVQWANKPVLLIKYASDQRYHPTMLSTHDKSMTEALPMSKLGEVPDEIVSAAHSIFIDEGSMFSDLKETCEKWANLGKHVTIASLDGTWLRQPFGQICELLPLAENVEKLSAVCMCCRERDASFTIRINTDNVSTIQIGGAELYKAACRACWNQHRTATKSSVTNEPRSLNRE